MPRSFLLVSAVQWLAIAGIAVIAIVVVIQNRSAARRLPELGSPAWLALQAGIRAEQAEDPALVGYAARTRRWQWIGLGIAVVVTILWNVYLGDQMRFLLGGEVLVAGWFAGGLLPELFARHRAGTEVRVAQLSARSPAHYATPSARRWLIASFAITAVAAALAIAVGDPLAGREVLAVGGSVVVAAVAITAIVRIARRAHPAGTVADLTVDEAIRSSAVTRMMSAWVALQFLLATALLPPLRDDGWSWPVSITWCACFIGVLAAWAWVPTRLARRDGASSPTVFT